MSSRGLAPAAEQRVLTAGGGRPKAALATDLPPEEAHEVHVVIEAGAGVHAGFSDAEYTEAGATLSSDTDALLGGADILLRVNKPALEDVKKIKRGALHISYLDPYNEAELIDAMAAQGVSSVSSTIA